MADLQPKKGRPPGVSNWTTLSNAGDVKRYLRWLILQVKANKIDVKKAGVMGQLGLYLLKSIEVAEIETQLNALEQHLAKEEPDERSHDAPTQH